MSHPLNPITASLERAADGEDAPSFELSPHASITSGDARRLAAHLAPDADAYLKVTRSLCPDCVAEEAYENMIVPMIVYEEAGEIRLAKECEDHGEIRDVYWSDADLYYRAREWGEFDDHLDSYHVTPDQGGITCPTDCGLCPLHKTHTGLGNITVTNRCDLSCWYCFFYAQEDDPIYEPTIEEIREMVRSMTTEEPIGNNAIQITGGEPTVRDDIVEVVEAVSDAVDHIQLNTHSGRLANDEELARDLREAGVNTIYTSFDGVSPETNAKNFWEMPEAIRTYRNIGMATVLVPTLIGGHNMDEVGDIIRFAAANAETIRGVNFQPVSLVGRMPDHKRNEQRVTIPDAIHAIEEQTEGGGGDPRRRVVPDSERVARLGVRRDLECVPPLRTLESLRVRHGDVRLRGRRRTRSDHGFLRGRTLHAGIARTR